MNPFWLLRRPPLSMSQSFLHFRPILYGLPSYPLCQGTLAYIGNSFISDLTSFGAMSAQSAHLFGIVLTVDVFLALYQPTSHPTPPKSSFIERRCLVNQLISGSR